MLGEWTLEQWAWLAGAVAVRLLWQGAAIGLFAAIPAVIAYNKFSSEIASFSGKLEDFGSEFSTIISRQIEG